MRNKRSLQTVLELHKTAALKPKEIRGMTLFDMQIFYRVKSSITTNPDWRFVIASQK